MDILPEDAPEDPLAWVRFRLPGSCLERALTDLEAIYRKADRDTTRWRERGGFACPPGCGTCCERWDPEVLPAEADYLAAWLLRREPGLVSALRESAGPPPPDPGPGRSRCPFYDPAADLHCRVYPARPLVCRLFGFAGLTGRRGETVFPGCPRARPAPGGPFPPLMAETGSLLAALGGAAARPRPLRAAARDALERIGLLERLAAADAGVKDGAVRPPGRVDGRNVMRMD